MALFHTTVVDNQIKALDTIGTATGSIATFDTDKAERLVKCVCEVASGASEINVVACGKNLFDSSTLRAGDYNGTNPTIRVSQNLSDRIKCCAGTTYTFSFITGNDYGVAIILTNENNVIIENISLRNYNNITFTPTTSGYLAIVFLKGTDAPWGTLTPTDCQNLNPMVEISDRATTYEAYNGTTLNIPFGETLSGDGSLDVLSGILTRSDDTTKQLDANYIQTNNGINNVYCDTGDTEVNYIMTVGQAIS